MAFLPISKADMIERGWDYYDFLFISADAYVDHPSFGTALLSRLLEAEGYRVAICAQPDVSTPDSLTSYGRPRLGVLVSGGVIDSMVNHYTAAKKKRSEDVYSPGGKAGKRPDRATIVYGSLVRRAFGKIPLIIGGTEASLRRFSHYDYWGDNVRRSIIFDSRADIISFGMGEKSIIEIANALADGTPVNLLTNIRGTCYIADNPPKNAVILPSFEETRDDKVKYAEAAAIQYREQDPVRGVTLAQKHGDKYVVQNPMSSPLTQSEMDRVYALPYERAWHPSYDKYGGIPAYDEVKFSITSSRGCFGNCSFCAITFHQGRIIQSRSHASILREAENFVWDKDFKGYIHDVGGPTANFRSPACDKQLKSGACRDRQCLYPAVCPNAKVDHSDYIELLRELRSIPKVKKVFIRSGIRYDYCLADKDDTFFRELCAHHVSGQLKVAPEHISDNVLRYMGKPGVKVYNKFKDKFYSINREIGKEQYLVPYLMSSHPGSTINDAIELALYLKENKIHPEQVQDFYPTPGTLSTAMFYTGLDPRTMKRVYVPRDPKEKAMQRAMLQWSRPENYKLVREALIKANRRDLIGFGEKCLIRPEIKGNTERRKQNGSTNSGRKGPVGQNKGGAPRRGRRPDGKGR
ncbi:MAG: YgiQ family radical SAM protein [Oscillospiraceae bacterium]|nr:YgiQ family radical SAM protein [Oscillospiraceae bacterium]